MLIRRVSLLDTIIMEEFKHLLSIAQAIVQVDTPQPS